MAILPRIRVVCLLLRDSEKEQHINMWIKTKYHNSGTVSANETISTKYFTDLEFNHTLMMFTCEYRTGSLQYKGPINRNIQTYPEIVLRTINYHKVWISLYLSVNGMVKVSSPCFKGSLRNHACRQRRLTRLGGQAWLLVDIMKMWCSRCQSLDVWWNIIEWC